VIAPGPGALGLTAGGSGVLSFTIDNSGQTAARNVSAELSLPAGVEFAGLVAVPESSAGVVVPAALTTSAAAWVCTPGTGSVTCTAGELPAVSSTPLAVAVRVSEDLDATSSVNVGLRIVSDSAQTQLLTSTAIAPAPARIALDAPAGVQLTTAAASTVTIGVRNAGATLARSVQLVVTLPDGVSWAQTETGAWNCVPAADPRHVTCTSLTLTARTASALPLSLLADGTSGGSPGSVAISATFDGAAAPVDLSVPIGVAPAPARLGLSAPATLSFTRGVATTLVLQIANLGGTDEAHAAVHLDVPSGVVLSSDSCGVFESSAGVTCLLGLLPANAGAVTLTLNLISDVTVAADSTMTVSLSAPATSSVTTSIALQAADPVVPSPDAVVPSPGDAPHDAVAAQ